MAGPQCPCDSYFALQAALMHFLIDFSYKGGSNLFLILRASLLGIESLSSYLCPGCAVQECRGNCEAWGFVENAVHNKM